MAGFGVLSSKQAEQAKCPVFAKHGPQAPGDGANASEWVLGGRARFFKSPGGPSLASLGPKHPPQHGHDPGHFCLDRGGFAVPSRRRAPRVAPCAALCRRDGSRGGRPALSGARRRSWSRGLTQALGAPGKGSWEVWRRCWRLRRRAVARRAVVVRGRQGCLLGVPTPWGRPGRHAHPAIDATSAAWLAPAHALAQPRTQWRRRRWRCAGRVVCGGSMGPLLVVVLSRWRGSTGRSGANPKRASGSSSAPGWQWASTDAVADAQGCTRIRPRAAPRRLCGVLGPAPHPAPRPQWFSGAMPKAQCRCPWAGAQQCL